MYEFIPIGLGILIGLMCYQLMPGLPRWLALTSLSVVTGVLVAVGTGEVYESWAFVLFDTAQAALASLATLFVVGRLRESRVHSNKPSG